MKIRKETVTEALLEPGLSEPAQQLLQLRQDGAGTAALKFSTLRRWTCDDGEPRIYGAYRYHGSSSGRFTSIGVQLHNLRKPELPDVAGAIAAVATGSLKSCAARVCPPAGNGRDSYPRRGMAGPGRRLFIADLSGIESRGPPILSARSQARAVARLRSHRQTGGRALLPHRHLHLRPAAGERPQGRQDR